MMALLGLTLWRTLQRAASTLVSMPGRWTEKRVEKSLDTARMSACATILILVASFALAQRTMTIAQLEGFVKSSVAQKLDDKQVSEVLKHTRLSEKLDQKTLSALMNLGTGPMTSMALREMSDTSQGLPAPAAPPAAAAPAAEAPPPKFSHMTSVAPLSDDQTAILEQVRDYAINYTQNLPNFICNQVTHRQVDTTGTGKNFREMDKLQEVLTYFEHHESYKVVAVNGQLVNNKDHLKLGGTISEGEFGSMMAEIFAPESAAEFAYDHLGKWDGTVVHEFRYHIPVERSHYTIFAESVNRKITAGYHGMIYASRDNNAVVRITLECEDMPADFPVKEVQIDLRYGTAKISDQVYMVPIKWDMHSRDGKDMFYNSAEFALYRKFETNSTLKFDTDDTDDKSDSKKEDAKPPVKKQP
jgi:hypothetical protein